MQHRLPYCLVGNKGIETYDPFRPEDVIYHLCRIFNSGLLKFGHEWVITSNYFTQMYLLIHVVILMVV